MFKVELENRSIFIQEKKLRKLELEYFSTEKKIRFICQLWLQTLIEKIDKSDWFLHYLLNEDNVQKFYFILFLHKKFILFIGKTLFASERRNQKSIFFR